MTRKNQKSKPAKKTAAKKSKKAAAKLPPLAAYRLQPNGKPVRIGGMSATDAKKCGSAVGAIEALANIQLAQADVGSGDMLLLCADIPKDEKAAVLGMYLIK